MLKSVAIILALGTASAALAQNSTAVPLGRLTEGEVPAAQSKSVTFTTSGTYGDDGEHRMIDAAGDVNGDGKAETGVLRFTCNGGDIFVGTFTPGTTAAKRAKVVTAAGTSPLAKGKSLKGNTRPATGGVSSVMLASDQPDICA